MDKTTLLAELKKQRLVAVIRGKDEEEVTNIVDAVYRGGIHFMEITYTIPQAEQVIAHLCKAYEHCDDIIIGQVPVWISYLHAWQFLRAHSLWSVRIWIQRS